MIESSSFYFLQDGLYHFVKGGEVLFKCDKVALAFDKAQNSLLKHGPSATTRDTYERFRRVLRLNQGSDENLVYVEGTFSVEELNRIVNNPVHLRSFYARFLSNVEATSWTETLKLLQDIREKSKN